MGIAGRGIWIQGAGELASGVAFRLVRCGYQVVMSEIPKPLAVRRFVCFSEAVFEGSILIEGVRGKFFLEKEACFRKGEVAVLVDPEGSRLSALSPAAVVDARMTKKEPQPLTFGSIPLIGLGPGFSCGQNSDFVIETHREARLGEVICKGGAAANTGIPGSVLGSTNDRVVRSPADGYLEPMARIGDLVTKGQVLGHVSGQEVVCGVDGLLRGLVHPQAELLAGIKVGDIDPRGLIIDPFRISDKALAVAGGVLEALLRLHVFPEI